MEKPESENLPGAEMRALYPHFSDEELREADENLRQYVALALQIYERIRSDPESYAQFKTLTVSKSDSSMHDERSDPSAPSHHSSSP